MKTVQLLLPDNLHHQLQSKATEAGFDLSTYMLALLAEGAAPRTSFPTVTTPAPPPVRPPDPPSPSPAPPLSQPPPPRATPAPYSQTPGHTKGPQSNMAVVIRWDLLGKGDREAIRASTAAATLVHILKRLGQVLGNDTLEQLTRFRVSRGPLVSRNPGKDFVNGSTKEIYGNHPIPGTGLYVLTHSSTDQKIQDLKELLAYLKIPSKLFEITKHRKS